MISVGLPAVKPQFLKEAIQSVLDQRYPDFELIVLNDRSDGSIRDIVKSFTDQRINYYEGGSALPVVENWNRVLSLAKGDYFVLFADDDRYLPDFLREMNMLSSKYPLCDIFHSRVGKIDSHGDLMDYTQSCPEYESGLEFIFNRINGVREQFAPEFMVKRGKLRDIGGFIDLPLAWGSDDMTWFKMAMTGGVAYSSLPLVEWRQSALQISETGDVAERLSAVEKYSAMLADLVESVSPRDHHEEQILQRIKLLLAKYSADQKAYLVAMSARYASYGQQAIFFLKNRKKFQLKFKWLLYSYYAKIKRPGSKNARSSMTNNL